MAYSLDLLPVQGLDSPAQTVLEARARLVATSNILDRLLNLPQGLSADLRGALLTIRYHVTAALSFIAAFVDMGGQVSQSHTEVQGLQNSIDLHLEAVEAARPLWTLWLADEYADGLPVGKTLPAAPRAAVVAQAASYFLPSVGPVLVRRKSPAARTAAYDEAALESLGATEPAGGGDLLNKVSEPLALSDYIAMGAVALAAVMFIRASK